MRLTTEQLKSLETLAPENGKLDLSDRSIDDNDLSQIVSVLNKNKLIVDLVLRHNNIRDEKHLLGTLLWVVVLDLSYNNINDRTLPALLSSGKLREINLECNNLGATGAKLLLSHARTNLFFKANIVNNPIEDKDGSLKAEAKTIGRITF